MSKFKRTLYALFCVLALLVIKTIPFKTSILGREDTLQYVSQLPNKRRAPSKTVKYIQKNRILDCPPLSVPSSTSYTKQQNVGIVSVTEGLYCCNNMDNMEEPNWWGKKYGGRNPSTYGTIS